MKKQLRNTLAYLADRLRERSTWLGISAVISGAGIVVEPALMNTIMAIGMAIAGIICILTKDQRHDTTRRSRVRSKGRKTLQEPQGTPDGERLQMEPAAPPCDSWRQKLS